MTRDGPWLLVPVVGILIALGLMVICLSWPSPRTIGIFLGVGLPIATGSMIVFALYVLRDLRARRAL